MKGFTDALKRANTRLSQCQLVQHGGRLYVRSSRWPSKPGSKSKRPEHPTGYRANEAELKMALAVALEMDADLLMGRFSWAKWVKGETPAQSCLEWLDKLERDYWQRHERTPNTENTWRKSYRQYYNRLPAGEALTELVLLDVLNRYKAGSRSRQLCATALGMLAKFAGVDHTKILALGRGYMPAPKSARGLPTDEQIEYAIDNCDRRDVQLCAGLQAVFGLRNHEVFRLERSQVQEGVARVLDNAKTGSRAVYAYPFEWVERWQLWDGELPQFDLTKANNDLGSRLSQLYKRYGLHRPYQYRDAWILRVRLQGGVDRGVSSLWAGHSPEVEDRAYFSAIQERHHQEVFERLKQRNQKTL